MRMLIKKVWYFVGTVMTVVGSMMLFGIRGANEFISDMALRLKVEAEVKDRSKKEKE